MNSLEPLPQSYTPGPICPRKAPRSRPCPAALTHWCCAAPPPRLSASTASEILRRQRRIRRKLRKSRVSMRRMTSRLRRRSDALDASKHRKSGICVAAFPVSLKRQHVVSSLRQNRFRLPSPEHSRGNTVEHRGVKSPGKWLPAPRCGPIAQSEWGISCCRYRQVSILPAPPYSYAPISIIFRVFRFSPQAGCTYS